MKHWPSDAMNIESVRVDRTLLERILNALDKSPCGFHPNRRRHERIPYRGRQVILHTKQAGKDVVFIVPGRNISRGGLSFLHGQMMHLDQPCTVDLATAGGDWESVSGTVIRCRHIRGMIHEIAMKFHTLVNLESLRDIAPAVQIPTAERTADSRPDARPRPGGAIALQPLSAQRLAYGSGDSKR